MRSGVYPALSLLVALVPMLLAACSSGELDPRHARTDTLPSGRVVVTNDGQGEWTPVSAWRLEEDLRLGKMDVEGPELFARIASVTADDEGRIYVLDGPSAEIRVFSNTGEFSQQIGGRGDGPGEIPTGSVLAWGPEGRLWVWSTSRITVLDTSGAEVARYPRAQGGIVNPWPGAVLEDGRLVDWTGARETTGREQVGNSVVTFTSGRTTFVPQILTPPDRWESLPALEYTHPVTERGQLKGPALKSLTLHSVADGIWFSHPDEYAIYKRTFNGDTVLAFSLPERPAIPVPVDSLVSAASQFGRPRSPEEFYSHLRVVTRILSDRAGHVYVFPQEVGVPQGSAVDVFLDSGVYLGRMTLPSPVLIQAPVPYVTRDHLYAVLEDELDVPYVARFRIVRP